MSIIESVRVKAMTGQRVAKFNSLAVFNLPAQPDTVEDAKHLLLETRVPECLCMIEGICAMCTEWKPGVRIGDQ